MIASFVFNQIASGLSDCHCWQPHWWRLLSTTIMKPFLHTQVKQIVLGSIWCLLLLSSGIRAAEITGTVSFSPRSPQTPVMISPYARNRYRPPRTTAPQLAGTSETIIVYLDDHPALEPSPAPTTEPVIDQRELTILPHVTPIVSGTTVTFLNSDMVYHNIFSLSKAKQFNLGRYPAGEKHSVTFDRPGVVEMFCDIHSEMNGVVLVLPNPYFTTVKADGSYRISNIPPGTYVVKGWREHSRETTTKVVTTTTPEEEIILNFQL